jgi:hypothetical protein
MADAEVTMGRPFAYVPDEWNRVPEKTASRWNQNCRIQVDKIGLGMLNQL